MRTRAYALAAVLALGAVMLGCSQQPQQKAAASVEKDFTLMPASVVVQNGILSGELRQMQVSEQVDSSGKVVVEPRLSGTLNLKNTSADQVARVLAAKLVYVGADGKPIDVASDQSAPVLSFVGLDSNQLAPGAQTSQSVDVDFPAAALKPGALKEVRLDLKYEPLPYKDQSFDFKVALAAKK